MQRALPQSVLTVDEDRMSRLQLRAHLQRHTRLRICDDAADLDTAQALARRLQPGFIVVELPLGGAEVSDSLAALRRCAPQARLVVICADDAYAVQSVFFAAGAEAVVHRSDAPEGVVTALAELGRGRLYASPHAEQRLLEHLRAPARAAHVLGGARLSEREREVLALLGAGLRRQAIAARLGISPRTVETHQAHLKEKLGAPTFEKLLPVAEAYAAARAGKR